jgi:hypothetical protein
MIETSLRVIITLCLLAFIAGVWAHYQYSILQDFLRKFKEESDD